VPNWHKFIYVSIYLNKTPHQIVV